MTMTTTTWSALGTTAELAVSDPAALEAARTSVESVVQAIDAAASRFRADSELSRLNASAGTWFPVSELFSRALRVALDAAASSDGLVDPTVGRSLVELGYDRTYRLLPENGPAVRLSVGSAPGWRCVELDEAGARVRIPVGVVLDLGATAKALASDIAAAAAAAVTGCGVLVSLGGDIAIVGATPPDGWPVLVTDARVGESRTGGPSPDQVVVLREGGLATSGTAARRWRRGGSQFHHLIDPRTGASATSPWRTVSVTADSCVQANVASTSSMIMGTRALAWLGQQGLPARLVSGRGSVTYVGGWPTPIPVMPL
jgi:thiamine biosynthesis lipoprotein ApbE